MGIKIFLQRLSRRDSTTLLKSGTRFYHRVMVAGRGCTVCNVGSRVNAVSDEPTSRVSLWRRDEAKGDAHRTFS
jgi:hypothetical protein